MKDIHLAEAELKALKTGKMGTTEKITALTHLGECRICAEKFACCFESEKLLPVSPDLLEDVLKGAIRASEARNSSFSPRAGRGKLLAYSCKVSIAACITFALLFSGAFGNSMQWASQGISVGADWKGISKITKGVRDFSGTMLPEWFLTERKGD